MQDEFLGREREQARLAAFLDTGNTGLVCVRGRRRIGKSRLLEKLSRERPHCFFFEGRYNENTRAAQKRFGRKWDEFTGEKKLSLLQPRYLDWDSILDAISEYARQCDDDLVIILDEIQWLDKRGSGFVGAIKGKWSAWQRTRKIKVIIAGSSNKFFRDNVEEEGSPLRGMRTAGDITVGPFTLTEVKKLWFPYWSEEEVCLLYMMVGGVPYYLEQIGTQEDDNFLRAINGAIFTAGGIFLDEINETLNLEFSRASKATVIKILDALGQEGATQETILRKTGLPQATMYETLSKLRDYGLVFEKLPIGQRVSGNKRGAKYYMRDFFLNFYFQILRTMEDAVRNNTTGKMLVRDKIVSDSGFYISDFSGKAFELLMATILENKEELSPAVFKLLKITGTTYHVGSYWEDGKTQVDIVVEDASDRESRLIEVKWLGDKANMAQKAYIDQVKTTHYQPPKGYGVRYYLALSRGCTEEFANVSLSQDVQIIRLHDLFGL